MNGDPDKLPFTKSDFLVLKDLYNQAINNKQTQFKFKRKIILTSYAKYLIEYLAPQFPDKN